MTAPQPYWSDSQVSLYFGDCRDVLPSLEAASVDAIVTDPPYDLTSGKRGGSGAASLNPDHPAGRSRITTGGGFMGQEWDATGVAFDPATWRAALRVLKPGGHLLAFGGTRTWHRMVCAIEDAGFEIREPVADLTGIAGPGLIWMYAQGFPKSLNAERAVATVTCIQEGRHFATSLPEPKKRQPLDHVCPQTPESAPWDGWGTALRPSWEPIAVARKPLAGTVAANVLAHGTGALNIDGCRIHTAGSEAQAYTVKRRKPGATLNKTGGNWRPEDGNELPWEPGREYEGTTKDGRWPPNVLLTHSASCQPAGLVRVRSDGHHPAARGPGGLSTSGHSGQEDLAERKSGIEAVEAWNCAPGCPVAELDKQSGVTTAAGGNTSGSTAFGQGSGWNAHQNRPTEIVRHGDTGGASRFFPIFRYQAKANASERPRLADGTAHPTVKPLELVRWLIRLVTPPGGKVLDMFAGSGPMAEGCIIEGFPCVLIEQDPKSAELIRVRLSKDIQPDIFGGGDAA